MEKWTVNPTAEEEIAMGKWDDAFSSSELLFYLRVIHALLFILLELFLIISTMPAVLIAGYLFVYLLKYHSSTLQNRQWYTLTSTVSRVVPYHQGSTYRLPCEGALNLVELL